MSDDGRLDLDDTGSVVGSGSDLHDLDLVGDDSRPTWAERLQRAGVTPWLRAHPLPTAAAATTLVLAVVASAVWVHSQPPPWKDVGLTALAAELDTGVPGVGVVDDSVAVGAFVVRADDPDARVIIDGLEGPGIRASAVGSPRPGGDPASTLVRAVIGCDGPANDVRSTDYALRVTVTDAWGRTRPATTELPTGGYGVADVVRETCWSEAAANGVSVLAVQPTVDLVGGSVALRLEVASTMSVSTLAHVEAGVWSTVLVPVAPAFTELRPGSTSHLDGRIVVTDCSGGTPAPPDIAVPAQPGVGLVVLSRDQQAGSVLPLVFSERQRADVQAALQQVCVGAPPVTASGVRVLASRADPGQSTFTLTVALDVGLPPGRQAIVGIDQDAGLGYPYPARSAWATPTPGGGRVTAPWTFSCDVPPAPPSLDVRFVDSASPTPEQIPLDQEALAPWVTAACPRIAATDLVDSGWLLP